MPLENTRLEQHHEALLIESLTMWTLSLGTLFTQEYRKANELESTLQGAR